MNPELLKIIIQAIMHSNTAGQVDILVERLSSGMSINYCELQIIGHYATIAKEDIANREQRQGMMEKTLNSLFTNERTN